MYLFLATTCWGVSFAHSLLIFLALTPISFSERVLLIAVTLTTARHCRATSSSCLPDDLAAMTANFADMKVQAQKVQAFVAWSGVTVNCKKCAITGMLYGQAQRDGSSSVLSKSMINMMKDRVRQIKIHNTEIPFYHPHTDPYKYLGVDITPTFNWAPHLGRIVTETKHKAQRLLSCALSKAQKMRILCTAIDPSITIFICHWLHDRT